MNELPNSMYTDEMLTEDDEYSLRVKSWKSLALAPNGAFDALRQFVANWVGNFDKLIRDTSSPDRRLDLVQQRIGATSIQKTIEEVFEAADEVGVPPAFNGHVDLKVMATLTTLHAFSELKDVWSDLLRVLSNRTANDALSKEKALNITSQIIGMQDLLFAISEAVAAGRQ
jgi:hypothetical protein